MKVLFVAGMVLFLVSQFLAQGNAIELCEPQDYYNLADSSKCSIKYNKEANASDSRELMFETLKTYPYELKDKFLKLLQRKIELVDNYTKQQQSQKLTEKVKANIGKLEQVKQDLAEQLAMVNEAILDNWVKLRDQATKTLKEATKRLHEVE